MNLSALMNGIFNDHDWLIKLAVTGAITAFAFIFTPVLIGLAGWALLFGYLCQLVINVRRSDKTPLPVWDKNFTRYLTPGANILIAFLIYNVPNLFLGCGWAFILGVSDGARIVGGTVIVASVCCLLPIILIYNLFMLPFFALGLARFGEAPQLSTFFAFGQIYEDLGRHLGDTVQYMIYLIGVLILLSLLLIVPVLGWALYVGLLIPLWGLLNGQYATLVLGAKAPAPPPKRPRAPGRPQPRA